MHTYFVYILASGYNGTLYIGITNDIIRRAYEHKEKIYPGFTKKYKLSKLVYIESCADIQEALSREKCLKKWNRAWKIKLIEEQNPNWDDLYELEFKGGYPPTRV